MAVFKEKAVMKIGMQYGKLITNASFQKPPQRKASFSCVTSAVDKYAVGLYRSVTSLGHQG